MSAAVAILIVIGLMMCSVIEFWLLDRSNKSKLGDAELKSGIVLIALIEIWLLMEYVAYLQQIEVWPWTKLMG